MIHKIQGCVATTVLYIKLCAFIDESFHCFQGTILDREHEGCAAIFSLGIYVRAFLMSSFISLLSEFLIASNNCCFLLGLRLRNPNLDDFSVLVFLLDKELDALEFDLDVERFRLFVEVLMPLPFLFLLKEF